METRKIIERPIIFSAPMVQAILSGNKTMTRRVIKPQPVFVADPYIPFKTEDANPKGIIKCPMGKLGDLLWVRETWADVNTTEGPAILYKASGYYRSWHEFSKKFGTDYGAGPSMDYDSYPGDYCMWWEDLLSGAPDHKWKSPRYMPKWSARIWLKVKGVRVERLQDITNSDAIAEGVQCKRFTQQHRRRTQNMNGFPDLWDSINKKRGFGWDQNPWVWVIEFEVTEQPQQKNGKV